MENETFVFYSDPGHGWLRVPRKYLSNLGIAGMISQYSYVKGDYAYLEEDCDMGRFFDAYENEVGKQPATDYVHCDFDSPIRDYPRYC